MFGDLTRVAAKQLGSDNQLQTKHVSQTSGQFQHMSVTYFAVHVLKCTDTYVQADITFFVIMVILWNGCIFLYIALTRLLVYLNWVNLLCRSVWPHCPYMVQCNTVYIKNKFVTFPLSGKRMKYEVFDTRETWRFCASGDSQCTQIPVKVPFRHNIWSDSWYGQR